MSVESYQYESSEQAQLILCEERTTLLQMKAEKESLSFTVWLQFL